MTTKVTRAKSLAATLDELTTEGAPQLTEHLTDADLRCYACGHRCLIKEGRRGICKVRFNEHGHLMVPTNYVATVACDPTEKKPFFHALPGSDTLTFGMLGCDMHCAYCFTGDTVVITDQGPQTFTQLFESAQRIDRQPDAEIAYHDRLRAITASGGVRAVRGVFRHHYKGKLATIRPYYLPALRCTPDHRVYATSDPEVSPQLLKAQDLTTNHFLAIPRTLLFSSSQQIEVAQELGDHSFSYRVPWPTSNAQVRQEILEASASGATSRQIGASLGLDASYVRHTRSKIARGRVQDNRAGGALIEKGFLRFPNEHRPGIPLSLPLDISLAQLLGYYCAEGCVTRSKVRPNSYTLNLSFAPHEFELAELSRSLFRRCFGVEPQLVKRTTTLAVATGKASVALLFKSLAGSRSSEKRVPTVLFDAERPVVKAFLNAYVEGDGHRYQNGKISTTTISRRLAYGIAWLALKLGHLPSIYETSITEQGFVQNRAVNRAPSQYTVVWYEKSNVKRKAIETENHYLIPLREVTFTDYQGDVYNMEVEEDHSYLAGLFAVSNCQNSLTSQTLRDEAAGVEPRVTSAERLVSLGLAYGASMVGSSYNEPLITAEWAVEVFKLAKAARLRTAFISNGNATPEVLDYLRPWTDCYKIDLKTMSDRNYRQLGAVVDNILHTIKMVHERGFWEEIVTLVIPGFNDSVDELRRAADFIAAVSPDIPWHVTAFHQDYKMTENRNTTVEDLLRACEIGREAGLRYVYAGNLPGRVGRWENTYCPTCDHLLVERFGFQLMQMNVSKEGHCPACQTTIPGLWSHTT